jgi:hypothetical protein
MTTPPQDLHPSVLDRFRVAAQQALTDSKDAAGQRDQFDQVIAEAAGQDKTDEAEQDRLERALEQVRARRAERARWMADRLTMRAKADAEAQRLEADGRRALEWIDEMEAADAGQQQQQPVPGALPPGVAPVDGSLNGSPLVTHRDPLPVEQDGSPA